MKRGRRGTAIGYVLSFLWLFAMALAGFFVPHFTDNINFFKIKKLYVEGLETIPPAVVVEEIKRFKNNWLFINKQGLMSNINKATGNAVKDLRIHRIFGRDGVSLSIYVQERKPFITAIKDNDVIFYDSEGTPFTSPYAQPVNIIYTQDIELINKNFNKIKNLIESLGNNIREAYATDLNMIVYTKEGIRLTLPSPFLLNTTSIKNALSAYKTYNNDMWAREIEVDTEGIVIVRGSAR